MGIRRFFSFFVSVLTLSLLGLAVPATSALASGDDDGEYELHGTIEQLPASGLTGDWVVSGRTVHVSASTTVKQEHGAAAVGARVEVKGDRLGDGSVDAKRIEVEPTGGGGSDDGSDDNGGGSTGGHAKFYGTIEQMPAGGTGVWTVSGRAVRVSQSTVVEREHGIAPAVGVYVEVEGAQLADGSVSATKVETKSASSGGSSSGYIEFRGRIESLPASGLVGTWTVGGRDVFVSATTTIRKRTAIATGRLVEVKGNQRPDGSVDARSIEAKAGSKGDGSHSFYGTVESMPAGVEGEWIVAGRTVVVSASTSIDQEHGTAAEGAYVEVHGMRRADGAIVASRIEVKAGMGSAGSSGYIEFKGTIESLPADGIAGDWVVSGRTVHVSAGIRLRQRDGLVRIGARVEVEGNQRTDGSVDAKKIDVKN